MESRENSKKKVRYESDSLSIYVFRYEYSNFSCLRLFFHACVKLHVLSVNDMKLE